MGNIEAYIEYFAFLDCCKLILSQIEITIKLLISFVEKDLKFFQMV